MWGVDKPAWQGGQTQGVDKPVGVDKPIGGWTKSGGGGTKWGQGHLAAYACTALSLGACPKKDFAQSPILVKCALFLLPLILGVKVPLKQ